MICAAKNRANVHRTAADADRARELWALGYSIRRIAAELGISRATVTAMVRGRFVPFVPKQREHAPRTVGRCPDCGGLVYGRCVACRARAARGVCEPPRKDRTPEQRSDDPTPAEIAARAEAIRRQWAPEEWEARR